MIKPILVAAAVSFAAVGIATAATVGPIASPKASSVTSDLVEVKQKGKGKYRGHKYRGHKFHRHHYRGGSKYRGWKRYHYRPYGWYGRGCVLIGPVWLCPW
jgi:Ni/Co efflux regulator RcnB